MTPTTTTFTIVQPPRKPRARSWPIALAVLLSVAGIAAAAGALTVGVREEAATLFAERVEIGDRFLVVDAGITAIAADATPLGTLAAPAEMAPALAQARTSLARDHWAYTVTVRESSADSVPSGRYVVSLHLDGVLLGAVHAKQDAREAAAVEGIRATFDVGAALRPSSLYYIVVEAVVESVPTTSFVVRSNPNGNQTWLGVGGGIDGAVNPTLHVAAGHVLLLTGRNADGQIHDISIRDGNSVLADSDDFDAIGEEATISWQAQAGTYSYQCRYHPGMKGAIAVA